MLQVRVLRFLSGKILSMPKRQRPVGHSKKSKTRRKLASKPSSQSKRSRTIPRRPSKKPSQDSNEVALGNMLRTHLTGMLSLYVLLNVKKPMNELLNDLLEIETTSADLVTAIARIYKKNSPSTNLKHTLSAMLSFIRFERKPASRRRRPKINTLLSAHRTRKS